MIRVVTSFFAALFASSISLLLLGTAEMKYDIIASQDPSLKVTDAGLRAIDSLVNLRQTLKLTEPQTSPLRATAAFILR
jgi:hypothetical protein